MLILKEKEREKTMEKELKVYLLDIHHKKLDFTDPNVMDSVTKDILEIIEKHQPKPCSECSKHRNTNHQ